jgi:hypothetical protein
VLITPKNWRDFQHYKDRQPPWIRLHRGLLDNFDFQCLPVASRALAPMLWLLASDSVDGEIDATPEKLAFRLRMPLEEVEPAIKPLIDKGFFTVKVAVASKPLAKRKRAAVPETEAETEALQRTEAETEQRQDSPAAADAATVATTRAVWASYAEAYGERYGVPPVRNAKVNGQISHFVKRLGADESPAVAAYFVGHQNALYVRAMHPVDFLLRDAEKLRTEWATRRQVTNAQAVQADRSQTNLNAFAPLIAEARARESKERNDAERSAA